MTWKLAKAVWLKLKKHTHRWEIELGATLLVLAYFFFGYIVPELTGFFRNWEGPLPIWMTALIATSDFFKDYLFRYILPMTIAAFVGWKLTRR